MLKSIADIANIPTYLTYDDVLLKPGFSGFSRQDISTKTRLSKNVSIDIPLVAAPMDTVVEAKLAIALAEKGGIAIMHRNMTVADQASHVAQVVAKKLQVGAAIGYSTGYLERAEALVAAGVTILLIDSAHGACQPMVDAVKELKQKFPKIDIIVGNVATYEGAKVLIEAGADSIRVGMGPGAICTTRIISGMGVPQLSALVDTVRAGREFGVPIIADGGIKYSGDMVKALATGAETIMMGSYFASCVEAPGELIELTAAELPPKFKHLVKPGQDEYHFKTYRGMGSEAAMKKGAQIKSEDEFHGKHYGKDRVMVAEGVEALVPIKGTVSDVVDQAMGGIKSGMYYVGGRTLAELQEVAEFLRITDASLKESHPHSLVITNAGKNY